MFIGEHAGTVFIWDVLRQETLRLPSGSITVGLPPEAEDQDLKECVRDNGDKSNVLTDEARERLFDAIEKATSSQ